MSKGTSKGKDKALKREKAKKKARRKTIIIVSILVLVVVAAAVVGIHFRNQNNKNAQQDEIFSYGSQSVHLLADGTFSAKLAHNVNKNGTYTKTEESGRTIVSFSIAGREEVGRIINGSLYLPKEWEDGHGHGSVFPRSK